MKTVNTKYNFWLGGYYDDFTSARAVADDLNPSNIRKLDHTKTHFGSAINGNARLNPRFKFSYPDRARSGYFNSADTNVDSRFSDRGLFSTADNKLTYNSGLGDWLTLDQTRDNAGSYSAKAHLQYPISINANRQKFNGSSSLDSYLTFMNGTDTNGKYYAPCGIMDFSYGATPIIGLRKNSETTSSDAHTNAGSPAVYSQNGERTSGYPNHDTADKTMITTSFASIYMAEIPFQTKNNDYARKYSWDIVSPSKTPFLINNCFIERGNGHSAPTTTSGTERLLNYDGNLLFKGIGESFHMRIRTHLISDTTATYTLKIGYKGDTTYDKSSDAFTDTTSLITITFSLANLGITGNIDRYDNDAQLPETDMWADIEIVPDFTLNNWKAYANGSTTHFANGSINTAVPMASAKGWSLDLNWTHGSTDEFVNVVTFIDRVAVALPLTNIFDGTTSSLPPVSNMVMNLGSNMSGSCSIKLLDDLNNYTLTPMTLSDINSEWAMRIFIDGEDRPLWTGFVESINHSQNLKANTLETTITSRDAMSMLERTLPIWEVGQNTTYTLKEHISMSSAIEKKKSETASIANTLLFGSKIMSGQKASLGFGLNDTESNSNGFSNIAQKRTNLYSGSAIQMYVGEDTNGPNDVYREWAGLNNVNDTDTDFYSEIIAIQNHAGKRSFFVEWHDPDNDPSFSLNTYRGITSGDSVTIKGTAYDGTYTVFTVQRVKSTINDDNKYYMEIRVTDATATDQEHMLFDIDKIHVISNNFRNSNQGLYKLTSSSAHNLAIGDIFKGVTIGDVTPNLKLVELKVVGIEDSTNFYVIGDPKCGINEGVTSSPTTHLEVYDNTKINGHNSKKPVRVSPVLYNGDPQGDDVLGDRAKHRNVHSRWIKDLSLSPWFKARFGVIAPEPHWRAGTGSYMHRPIPPASLMEQLRLVQLWLTLRKMQRLSLSKTLQCGINGSCLVKNTLLLIC